MIDTHAHLDDGRFAGDLPEVMERAAKAGVTRIITIGVDLATSRAALDLAKKHPHILSAAVGIQPNHVAEAGADDWSEILQLSADPHVAAIGETGLDRYWDRAPFHLQQEFFAKHIELGRRLDKAVIIHCREAEADVVEMLAEETLRNGPLSGVMHSFSGDAATAQACLGFGLHISFAGMLTYKNSESLRLIAKEVPHDRVLVETDSPYLSPQPVRGKRNEPANVIFTAECLAKTKGLSPSEIDAITSRNARELFGL